jgi:hypothetical protein
MFTKPKNDIKSPRSSTYTSLSLSRALLFCFFYFSFSYHGVFVLLFVLFLHIIVCVCEYGLCGHLHGIFVHSTQALTAIGRVSQSLVAFKGAFFSEGSVVFALEYMNRGASTTNNIPREPTLFGITPSFNFFIWFMDESAENKVVSFIDQVIITLSVPLLSLYLPVHSHLSLHSLPLRIRFITRRVG